MIRHMVTVEMYDVSIFLEQIYLFMCFPHLLLQHVFRMDYEKKLYYFINDYCMVYPTVARLEYRFHIFKFISWTY